MKLDWHPYQTLIKIVCFQLCSQSNFTIQFQIEELIEDDIVQFVGSGAWCRDINYTVCVSAHYPELRSTT